MTAVLSSESETISRVVPVEGIFDVSKIDPLVVQAQTEMGLVQEYEPLTATLAWEGFDFCV